MRYQNHRNELCELIFLEQLGQTGGETAIDTQIEVDLICGGVGFDDGPTDDGQWLKEARDKQKSKVKDKEV